MPPLTIMFFETLTAQDFYRCSVPIDYITALTSAMYSEEGKFFSKENLRDALSTGQLYSKYWAFVKSEAYVRTSLCLLGSWHGLLASWYLDQKPLLKVTGMDLDPDIVAFSRRVVNSSHYDAQCRNCMEVESFAGFNMVVNTSAEHMGNEWLDRVEPGTTVLVQSNNYDIPEHTNRCKSMEDFLSKYRLREYLYVGMLKLPMYERYMVVGIK